MKKIIIIFAVLILGASLIVCISILSDRPKEFDSEEWKSGGQKQRSHMVENLIKSELLIGLTKDEVIELLEYPTKVWEFERESIVDGENREWILEEMIYYLGDYLGWFGSSSLFVGVNDEIVTYAYVDND